MNTPLLLSTELMHKLDQLELVTRRQFMGKIQGEKPSPKKGHSLEFADYRNYVHGDDIRFIDWKIFARLDRLFLKLFIEEEDLFIHFLIDTSHSMGMGDPSKILYAKQLIAALAYISLAGTHRVSIQPYSSNLGESLTYTRGKSQITKVLQYLAKLETAGETHSLENIRRFRSEILGTGVLFLISDFLDKDGVENALKQLVAGKFEVVVFHLLSPEEEKPEWDGDWKLVDVEDGQSVNITMGTFMRNEYSKTVRLFRAEHQDLCLKYGFQYVPICSDLPLESLLLFSLRKKNILG